MISFRVSDADSKTINAIVDRTMDVAKRHSLSLKRVNVLMDLTATHANGNPLRLAELLGADDFNFSHDVFGIMRHVDRETGALTGFFSPRYSAR